MVITVRGTDINQNKSAHILAVLASMSAVKKSRKSLIIQLKQNATSIEDILKGKEKSDTEIKEYGFLNDDTGIDALMLRVDSMKLQKEHFDACVSEILEQAENMLDVLVPSKKEDFEEEILNSIKTDSKSKESTDKLGMVIEQAKAVYDDIYIYANSNNSELMDLVNKYTDIEYVCIRQGKKEPVSHTKEDAIYVITNYDSSSFYNVRYIKNMYGVKQIACIPYNTEFKDAYNEGRLIHFIGKNEKISESDVNYNFIKSAYELIDKVLENKKIELSDVPTYKEIISDDDVEDLSEYEEPQIKVIEERKHFGKKVKKVVDVSVDEEEILSEDVNEETVVDNIEEVIDDEIVITEDEENDNISIDEKKENPKRKTSKRNTKTKESEITENVNNDEVEISVEENMVVTDTKGELYKETAHIEKNDVIEETVIDTKPKKEKSKVFKKKNASILLNDNEWTCPVCSKINSRKFCMECGSEKPKTDWICPVCNEVNSKDAKFCVECGCKKPM